MTINIVRTLLIEVHEMRKCPIKVFTVYIHSTDMHAMLYLLFM